MGNASRKRQVGNLKSAWLNFTDIDYGVLLETNYSNFICASTHGIKLLHEDPILAPVTRNTVIYHYTADNLNFKNQKWFFLQSLNWVTRNL